MVIHLTKQRLELLLLIASAIKVRF